ncbi:MAG TPA: membrane protein insertion efficiency factor YidD [Candidatus Bathyarchaeia archaeon]|nr:membrane protein insertion efficiency factor YidD [Candidatus Bathyarchaeia archaeon]
MIKSIVLRTIRLYQRSPFFHSRLFKIPFLTGDICRFQPSCSQYAYQAIEKYGILRGSLLTLGRIFRCHPWSKGGQDPI